MVTSQYHPWTNDTPLLRTAVCTLWPIHKKAETQMNETIPLKAEATNEQTPEPKSGAVRRRFGMAAGIVATVACTGALTAFHRSSEEARKQVHVISLD